MRNPNTLRRTRLASTVTLLAAGAIACTAKSTPPPETADNKPVEDPPACTSITATPPDTTAPLTMKIKLETTDSTDIPTMWSPDHAEYSFGDGTEANDPRLTTTHTYQAAGTYTVNAAIVMDVANPGDKPFQDGKLICPPTLIAVP